MSGSASTPLASACTAQPGQWPWGLCSETCIMTTSLSHGCITSASLCLLVPIKVAWCRYLAFGSSMDFMYEELHVQYPLTLEVGRPHNCQLGMW